ncbi:MAG: hypothetical protein WCK48_02755 [bacterium]
MHLIIADNQTFTPVGEEILWDGAITRIKFWLTGHVPDVVHFGTVRLSDGQSEVVVYGHVEGLLVGGKSGDGKETVIVAEFVTARVPIHIN